MTLHYTADDVRREEAARVRRGVGQSVQGAGVARRQRNVIHLIAGVHGALEGAGSGEHQHHRQAVASGPDRADETETGPQRGNRVPELERGQG